METKPVEKKKHDHYYIPLYKTAYGPRIRVSLSMLAGEGRTKQNFRDECDINVLMKRYQNTGVLEHVRDARNARFQDVSGQDFQAAMDVLATARTAFEELPAAIRDRFDNDPAQLLDFVQDEDNREEAADLGLLTDAAVAALKAEKEKPAPAAPASPAPEAPKK